MLFFYCSFLQAKTFLPVKSLSRHPTETLIEKEVFSADCTTGMQWQRLLHDGDETQGIVEAHAEHDFRIQRLIGMFRAQERHAAFVQSCYRNLFSIN